MKMCALILMLLTAPLFAVKPDMGSEKQIAAGKQIYLQKCAQCHGEEGDGQGPGALNLNPPPRDFTGAVYKIKTTPGGMLATTRDLVNIIRKGLPYTSMPAWPRFSEEELLSLAYFIKSFAAEDYQDEELLAEPIAFPSFSEPADKESLERGRAFFEENKCIDCHGKYGYGDGPSGPTLMDNSDNPMRAADLSKPWTWRGGSSKQAILSALLAGIEGTPMPSIADNFTEERQKIDIVNYVYSLAQSRAPDYANVLVARGVKTETLELDNDTLFAGSKKAHFPLMGQITEPGRRFNSSINSLTAQAVYNETEIAIKVQWHDMAADSGMNAPDIKVPLATANIEHLEEKYSDAVAIQIPGKPLKGIAKPYFIFGDKKNPVDLWFADLTKKTAQVYLGKGSQNLQKTDSVVNFTANFEDGVWTAIFKAPRISGERIEFKEEAFVPIAFSIWNGMRFERGNKRTLTRWFDLYLAPMEVSSPIYPAVKTFIMIFIFEILFVLIFRAVKKA